MVNDAVMAPTSKDQVCPRQSAQISSHFSYGLVCVGTTSQDEEQTVKLTDKEHECLK